MEAYPTALVLGLAASGEAAARLLLAEESRVHVVDQNDNETLRRRAAELEALGARVWLGRSDLPSDSFAVGVVSPGVPASSAWVQSLRQRGIPVISELELGWSRACPAEAPGRRGACPAEAPGRRRPAGRVLAVTGSNGKSTLVKLCAEALALAGRRVALAGNYGPPVSQVVCERRDWDWLVLEVSSFQLETVCRFRPEVGILLNVLPNHLDRHGDLAEYTRLKSRLFARMLPQDVGVVPEELAETMARLAAAPNRWLSFGTSPAADFRYQAGTIATRSGSAGVSLSGTGFATLARGRAAAPAAAALSAGGESLAALERAVQQFQPLPHRLQEVAVLRNVRFVDDSKATNLAAMLAALKMCPAPVRLIAGGLPKHESYAAAGPLLAEKVAAVYLIGAAAETMAAEWQAVVPCRLSRTLAAAVASAWAEARPGDTILLAPACASFDQFQSFEERGQKFLELIHDLK
jgi:UDP-N-acetylmuramoylalanine--D-glutamate ligase